MLLERRLQMRYQIQGVIMEIYSATQSDRACSCLRIKTVFTKGILLKLMDYFQTIVWQRRPKLQTQKKTQETQLSIVAQTQTSNATRIGMQSQMVRSLYSKL